MPVSILATTQYLSLDLFTGMDGLGHALESLGIADFSAHSAVIVYFEVDSRCRRLLHARRVRPGAYLSDVADSEGLQGSD
jgi:hypothetical protein